MGFIHRPGLPAGEGGSFTYNTENSSRLSNLRTSQHRSKQTLPPLIGCHSQAFLFYDDYHQRCSSESFLLEQPSWLDELLNEPETQVHKGGHRRSASDSSAYFSPLARSLNINKENNFKTSIAGPSSCSPNSVHHMDTWHASSNKILRSSDTLINNDGKSSLNFVTSSAKDGIAPQTLLPSSAPKEPEGLSSRIIKKHGQEDLGPQSQEGSPERNNGPQTKPSASKAEAKRAKQQSAHRSRVRKLQYIADLETNIQVLQAEGSEVSAQLEFLDQQILILGMENRALRQRLDSLSQEHLVKHLEQDMLEREIARLQILLQMQQQQQHSNHRQNKNRNFDSQFAHLSVKN